MGGGTDLKYYGAHILVCAGARCEEGQDVPLHRSLLTLTHSTGFDVSDRRIKINGTRCLGTCGNRVVAMIVENLAPGETAVNNATWLCGVDTFTDELWTSVFGALTDRVPLSEVVPADNLVKISEPNNDPPMKMCKGEQEE